MPSCIPIYNSLVSCAFSDVRLTFFSSEEARKERERNGYTCAEAVLTRWPIRTYTTRSAWDMSSELQDESRNVAALALVACRAE